MKYSQEEKMTIEELRNLSKVNVNDVNSILKALMFIVLLNFSENESTKIPYFGELKIDYLGDKNEAEGRIVHFQQQHGIHGTGGGRDNILYACGHQGDILDARNGAAAGQESHSKNQQYVANRFHFIYKDTDFFRSIAVFVPRESDGLADEGGRCASGNLHAGIVSGPVSTGGEYAHHVVGSAAAELLRIPFGRPFHQYRDGFPNPRLIAFQGFPVLQGDNLIKPAVLHIGRYVVLHGAVCKGARTVRICEHEGPVETHFLHEAEGFPVVFLRFRAEARNYVCGEAAVRHYAADLGHALQVPFPVVLPPHELQHPGAAALHRQVDVLADVVVGGHGFNYLVADVLGVGGGKTHPQVRAYIGHPGQQTGKSHGLLRAFPEVAVHVLSQQRDFLIAPLKHVAGLPYNGMRVPGTFCAAGIRHHAV